MRRNVTKKILAGFICAAMLLTCLPESIIPVMAEEIEDAAEGVAELVSEALGAETSGTCGENVTWAWDEATKTLTISADAEENRMKSYSLYDNRTEAPWHFYAREIETVIVKEKVSNIGACAFAGCDLTKVIIPSSVTSIGDKAFYYCEYLTDVVIPNSVRSIGDGAFWGCSSLESMVIPNSVTSIGDEVFLDCGGLTSVVIPNSVTSIGDQAFYYCDKLTDVVIPNSVTSIGRNAFYYCSSLESMVIPNSVRSIGGGAFYGCFSLTDVVIPNSVTSIGDEAFIHCESLTSVVIPNSVTSIGDEAFSHCESLTSVVIPNSVTSIGDKTFYYCDKLTDVVIQNGVTSIGIEAFNQCSSLTSVEIPGSVTSIGDAAFGGCSSLTSVEIPGSVTSIEDKAFSGCSSLTSVKIPESVTSIAQNTFYNCSNLTSVEIPGSVTMIEKEAFDRCSNLSDVYYSGTEEDWEKITIRQGNEALTNAVIHFNASMRDDSNEPVLNYLKGTFEVTDPINGKGYAYVQTRLLNKNGKAVSNVAINYTNGQQTCEAKSNEEGLVCFCTPYESNDTDTPKKGSATINYQLGKKSGSFVIKYVVNPVTFTEDYTGSVTAGAFVKTGVGAGAKIGPVEAQVGAEARAGVNNSQKTKMELKAVGSKTTAEFSNGSSTKLHASTSIGAGISWTGGGDSMNYYDKCPTFDLTLAKMTAEAAAYTNRSVGISVSDMNHMSKEDCSRLTTYLALATLEANSRQPFAQELIDDYLIRVGVFDVISSGYGLQAEAGAKALSCSVGPISTTVAGAKGAVSYDYTETNHGNGKKTLESVAVADAGVELGSMEIEIPLIEEKSDDEKVSGEAKLSPSFSLASKKLQNKVTVKAEKENDILKSVTLKGATSENSGVLYGEESEVSYWSVTAEDSKLSSILKDNKTLTNFDKGAPVSVDTLNEVAKVLSKSEISHYSDTSLSKGAGFEFPIEFSAALGIGFGLEACFAGAYERNYITGTSREVDKQITAGTKSAPEIPKNTLVQSALTKARDQLAAELKNCLDRVQAALADGLRAGKTVVEKVSGAIANWFVSVTTVIKSDNAAPHSYVVYAASALGSDEAEKQVTTIGETRMIAVQNESGEYQETLPEALKVTLFYDEKDLAAAGVNDEADLSKIAAFRFDEEMQAFIRQEGIADTTNKTVTINMTQPGEYVLGIDTEAPAITDFRLSDTGSTPSVYAYVADITGIKSLTMKLDGEVVVSANNFRQYLNGSDFSYKVPEGKKLSNGTHTLSFMAEDTCGNQSEEVTKEFVVGEETAVKGIAMDQKSVTLSEGAETTLKVLFTPENATNRLVFWSSSNDQVASVDDYGTVKALSEGIATVTAKSADGGYESSCSITVTKEEKPEEPDEPDEPDDPSTPTGLYVKGLEASYSYTGKALKPEFSIYHGTKLLTEKTDYTVSYKNNTKPGKAEIQLKLKGNLTGTKTLSFTITPCELSNVTADEPALIYKKGKVQKAVPALYLNGEKLKFKKGELTFTWPDADMNGKTAYLDAGEYRVHIEGDGKTFSGSMDVPVIITENAIPISSVSVKAAGSLNYTGEAVDPKLVLSYKGKTLESSAYSLEYLDSHTSIGKHTVILKGNGTDVVGTRQYVFQIKGKYDIGKAEASAIGEVPYVSSGSKPAVTLTFGGETLKAGRDYTLTYQDNKAVGTAKAIVKGKGSFAGTKTISFTVTKQNIENLSLQLEDMPYQSKAGKYFPPKLVFTDENYVDQKLKKGKDYKIELSEKPASETPEGGTEIKVTITGIGDSYTGTIQTSYRIIDKAKDFTKAKITVNGGKPYPYTGGSITPKKSEIKVMIGKQTLDSSSYEIIGVYHNVQKGSAVLRVRGIGDYAGVKTVKFKIAAAPSESLWS